jgi:hypothetical protein
MILLALLVLAEDQAGRIEGRVIDAISGAPVSNARISIPVSRTSGRPPTSNVATDSEGRFVIDDLSAGTFGVTAHHPRYPSAQGTIDTDAQQTISVAKGEIKKDVVFKLRPGGAVSGRVTNEEGEPLSRCPVHLVTTKLHRHAASAQTDDRGFFRIFAVPAGRYVVRADCNRPVLRPRPLAPRDAIPAETLSYKSAYHPASADLAGAVRIAVEPGSEVQGIEIRLLPVRTYVVAGQVELPPGADVMASFRTAQLVPREPDGERSRRSYASFANGKFRFEHVEPGAYWLSPAPFGPPLLHGKIAVDVVKQSIAGIVLPLRTPISMSARVEYDGEQRTASGNHPPFSILFADPERQFGSSPRVRLGEDGHWLLENVVPDRYLFQAGPQGYVSAVRVGERYVPGNVAEFADGDRGPLVVTISRSMATLKATVEGFDPKSPTQILIRAQGHEPAYMSRVEEVDSTGAFESKVPPGEYRVTATQGISSMIRIEAPIQDLIASHGERVQLKAGATTSIHLKAIPRAELLRLLNED